MKTKGGTRNKKLILIIAVTVISISAFFAGVFLYRHTNQTSGYEVSKKIEYMSEEERQTELNKIVDKSKINIKFAPQAVFNGKHSKEFIVQNSEKNNGDIHFSIYDANDKMIYQSKRIRPGYEVKNITLDKALSKGTHNCKISIGYVEDEGNVESYFPLTIDVV